MSCNYVKPGEYSVIDMLAVAAAREVKDGEIVFAGTGLPMLAIMLYSVLMRRRE